jgi:hypothetical protein
MRRGGTLELIPAAWTDLEARRSQRGRGRWQRSMICCLPGGCWTACFGVVLAGKDDLSEPSAEKTDMQLRLDLLESPAPEVALWELLPETERRAVAALVAR